MRMLHRCQRTCRRPRAAPSNADLSILCQLLPPSARHPWVRARTCPAGYEVQTVRLITRALSAAASAAEAASTAALLERLCLAAGISFINLGTTSSELLLREGVFQKVAEVTCHTSCSFRWVPTRRACCAPPQHAGCSATARHPRCARAVLSASLALGPCHQGQSKVLDHRSSLRLAAPSFAAGSLA